MVIPFSFTPKPLSNTSKRISSLKYIFKLLIYKLLQSPFECFNTVSNPTTTTSEPSIPGNAGGVLKLSSRGGNIGINGANGVGEEGGGLGAGFSGGAGG